MGYLRKIYKKVQTKIAPGEQNQRSRGPWSERDLFFNQIKMLTMCMHRCAQPGVCVYMPPGSTPSGLPRVSWHAQFVKCEKVNTSLDQWEPRDNPCIRWTFLRHNLHSSLVDLQWDWAPLPRTVTNSITDHCVDYTSFSVLLFAIPPLVSQNSSPNKLFANKS